MYRLEAYDCRTGNHLNATSIPFSKCSWEESWNTAGGMNVEIPMTRETLALDLQSLLIEQSTLLALWDDGRIVHAGPILESPEWDAVRQTLQVQCGDGRSLFNWRLVLDTRLEERAFDGPVTVDDDNPSHEWTVGFGGSGGDIIKGLIGLTQQWGDLCVNVPIGYPPQSGGSPLSLTWAAWDFATVGEAFDDVLALEHGGQLRFDPEIGTDGRFHWQTIWAENGIVDHYWRWHAGAPGVRVRFTGVGSSGNPIVNEVWASGGRNNDQLLLTRADDRTSQRATILLQAGSASNTSSLAALHSTAKSMLAGARTDRVWKLEAGREHDVHVGDSIDLRVNDPYIHDTSPDGQRVSTLVPLVVTDVGGDASSDWLTIQARQRADSIDGIRPGNSNPVTWLRNRMTMLERLAMSAASPSGTQAYGVVAKLRQLLVSEGE